MMVDKIVVLGAGGFGRETIDVIEALNAVSLRWQLVGVVDDAPSPENLAKLQRRGVTFLGDTSVPLAWAEPTSYVVGIGKPSVRRLLAERYDAAGFQAATLVHPAATLGSDVVLGGGTVICAGARLTTCIQVGRHGHLNPNVTIGHDTTLGDYVSMNPASSVSGDCLVEDEALIGVGAVVLNRLTVGTGALVGGAACVVRDVPPGAVMAGVPARPLY